MCPAKYAEFWRVFDEMRRCEMFLAVPFEPAMLSQLGSQGAQFTWHWASVTPEASRACGRAVAEASQRNRKGIAEAYQSSNVLASEQ